MDHKRHLLQSDENLNNVTTAESTENFEKDPLGDDYTNAWATLSSTHTTTITDSHSSGLPSWTTSSINSSSLSVDDAANEWLLSTPVDDDGNETVLSIVTFSSSLSSSHETEMAPSSSSPNDVMSAFLYENRTGLAFEPTVTSASTTDFITTLSTASRAAATATSTLTPSGVEDWHNIDSVVSSIASSCLNGSSQGIGGGNGGGFIWPDDAIIHNPTLGVILAVFCVITVFGNVLVMVAVARERYLHTVTNYFIVSLATADCLVGAVVMPFSAVHEVMNKFWLFGRDWCDLWHSLDVLGSSASILNLCVISLDRYWAITDPMSYPSRMTTRRACFLIALVWVCSSLISFPAIAWWRKVDPGPPPPYTCNFTDDVGYVVFSSIISFYGPLSVMLFTYYRIYRAAAAQTRSLRLGTKQVLACNGEEAMELTLRIHRGGGGGSGSGHRHTPPFHNTASTDSDSPDFLTADGIPSSSVRIVPKNLKHFSFSRKLAKIAKEQKAAKTLGIVVGVFVLCWLPFFVTSILTGICPDYCIYDPIVYSVVTWLGWINSGMNPVIYACWSRDFRRAFTKILCGCCPRVMNQQYRHRLRGKVCHVTSTPISSTCSTDCVKL